MKILYFTQFYCPESIAAAFRASDHAHYWADDGHEVTVFTGWPNYPIGRLFDGYEMVCLGEENDRGIRILRSASKIAPNTNFVKRVLGGLSFAWNGWRNCTRAGSAVGGDYDVILATSGTVFAAALGAFFARSRRIPLVVEFRDLTWKQMVASGTPEASWKVVLMRAMELRLCSMADRVIVLTEGFKHELAEQGVSEAKISVVPNGADLVPCEHDWSGKLRLGYFGTMGISQDVVRTLDLAFALSSEGLLGSYELIGEGAVRAEVERDISSGAYPFATLSHGIPKDELEPHYAGVHMTVVSLQDSDSFSGTIPSKIFQSFARGTPVLFIGPEGEAARLVRESCGGVALCGTDGENLNALRAFVLEPNLPERLSILGANASSFMERNYTRSRLAGRMLEVLMQASNRGC